MQVNKIENVKRIPLAIDYRRMYRADAEIAFGITAVSSCPIEFVLELSPYGTQQVSVSFLGPTDYPIIPAINLLREHIVDLDRKGSLP